MSRLFPSAILLIAMGCRSGNKDISDGDLTNDTGNLLSETDADGDGYTADEDCNDDDPQTHPNSVEICDGIDNNCDGQIDEGVTTTYYEDNDGDGFGNTEVFVDACEAPSGYVPNGNDCDDSSAQTYPGAPEACDGEDNDCDGEIDEDLLYEWYADTDGDGFGALDSLVEDCNPGKGYVSNSDDCDDTRSDVNPDSEEVCDEVDNDCDGAIDEDVTPTWYTDSDGDGYGDSTSPIEECEQPSGTVTDDTDCDDSDENTYPGAASAESSTDCMRDQDGDGYGDDDPPFGITAGSDCDDDEATSNPGETEICDDIDNDCDGDIDEDVTSTYYADSDGDGYGDIDDSVVDCEAPSGYVSDSTDCDDDEAAANPGETEVCDDIDNNCDGDIDEGLTGTYYADSDGDGYGDIDDSITDCGSTSGYVTDNTDCDDDEAAANPGETEVCDDIDNDCDGNVDEGLVDTYYDDDDGDGYGDSADSVTTCDPPSGYVTDGTDCDDSEATANPGETEVCDEIDNDCDGSVDEGLTTTYYDDDDGDGYGDSADSIVECEAPSGYVTDSTDCDDSEAAANPGETEVCDDIDNNCDGDIDEGLTATYYVDTDGDGYGNSDYSVTECSAPSGYVADGTDCDDTEENANPGAVEICDELDNNCDGDIDEGVENTYYADTDGDGFGDSGATVEACSPPSGYEANDSDCNDEDRTINPDAVEECNYIDEDCDSSIDEDFRTGTKYTDLNNCGYCSNDCEMYDFDNAQAYCDGTLSVPSCDFVCKSGYYDANGDDTDGCECFYLSAVDEPFDGIDADCDGSDGDHSTAVHVSTSGSASGDGSLGDPLDNVQDAIDLAIADGYSYVLVAEGTYEESLSLDEGLIIMGGFDDVFENRDVVAYWTTIQGNNGAPAVSAIGLTASTVFDGFSVEGYADISSSSSAIAVWLEDCDEDLILSNNTIWAGDATAGDNGEDGDDGKDGGNGDDGDDGGYDDCTSSRPGGTAGENTCDSEVTDGGDGGSATCPSYAVDQGDGVDGYGPDPGTAGYGSCDGLIDSVYSCGYCSIDSCWDNGYDGTDGGQGADGSGGTGSATAGSIIGGFWVTMSGSDGDVGSTGSGGGGGGAGSGAEVSGCSFDNHAGGTGGAGGAGGCGGEGALGGESGGSSFGVLVYCTGTCKTLPILTDNDITANDAGDAGKGGDGGARGAGGAGGNGGRGDRTTGWCGLDGGNGGNGGDGGAGGGGGGGAGGLSYAVYAEGVTPPSTWVSSDNDLSHGSAGRLGLGGAGGVSSNAGTDGLNGTAGAQNW